ncbi:MAG: 2,3-diaminopropionate biosynthesis protein SbnA [Bryobacteraceae bacterium]
MAAEAKARLDTSTEASGVLAAVGNTPLVQLTRVFAPIDFALYAKLEMMNPGGSGKDRSARGMLLDACDRGDVGPRTTIIESSSGNLGVGLAQACALLKLRFVCVVDSRTTVSHIAILKAYGAEVEVVDQADPVSGELLTARLNRVKQLQARIADSFWIDQYANPSNPRAQYDMCGELDRDLGRQVDYLFVATSTCGTLRGCRDYVRDHALSTKIIAVDAVGSVIFGNEPQRRLIPGHGASRRPALYESGLEDDCVHVSDRECVEGCFRLLQSEAILAGGSSGAVISAIGRMRTRIPAGAIVVAILCDRGDRYFETVYSREWISTHFGGTFRPWLHESGN